MDYILQSEKHWLILRRNLSSWSSHLWLYFLEPHRTTLLHLFTFQALPVLSSSHCMWSDFPIPLYPHPLLWTPPFLCKLSPVIPAAWEGHAQLADALCPWWLPCKPQVRQRDMSIFSNLPTRWVIHPRRNTCWFLPARPQLLSGAFIQKRAPSISSSVLPQMRIGCLKAHQWEKRKWGRVSICMCEPESTTRKCSFLTHLWTSSAC